MRLDSPLAESIDSIESERDLEVEVLWRIVRYCDRVSDDVLFFGDDEDIFVSDDRYQRSVAFCIFQIGENVKTLRKRFPEKYGSKYWRGIAGTRDVIGHGYESFDMESLWVTASERIPELRGICYDLLDELEE